MSKIIGAGIVILLCWFGWILYQQWESVQAERAATPAGAAASRLDPRGLPGMPANLRDALESSLDKAQRDGAIGLREWLKNCRQYVQDPRLGWIELDYCVLLAQSNPREAKRVFNEVKDRTPPTSPIYPRLKQLEKTYE
jgi:hypothetical protein